MDFDVKSMHKTEIRGIDLQAF